jgi:glutathione S-transferase
MPLKLRYAPASPFVRKVLVFAHEVGLADRIERVATDVWSADSDIQRDNPLGKVPALISQDGTFIGSTLCCDYLDTLHRGPPLIPTAAAERWKVLQLHALADGMMEAAVAHVVERMRRPAAFVYQGTLDRQEAKIGHALAAVEARAAAWTSRLDIATITLGCALGYLDFRLPHLAWRAAHPATASWYASFAARPAMVATQPHL